MEPDVLSGYLASAMRSAARDLADISALRIKIDGDEGGGFIGTCAQADWLVVTGSSFRETWYAAMGSIMLIYDWVHGDADGG